MTRPQVGDIIRFGEYGTAQAQHVLDGYTIGTDDGVIEGTMPNNGIVTITPNTSDQVLNGFFASGSKVVGDADLVAENIAEGKNIFGKVGTHTGHTFTASSNVKISANTARSLPFGSTSSDSQKLKEIRIGKSGTVRVKLTAKRVGTGFWDCFVYQNGVRNSNIGFGGSGTTTYTHSDSGDITVSAGDLLQVYGCTNVSATLYTFEICYDLVPIPTSNEAVVID